MDLIDAFSECFGICGSRNDRTDSPRWADNIPVSAAFTDEKQMRYSASEVDLENPDDIIDYVVCTVLEGGDNDSIRADLERVRAKFKGTETEALFAWKAKVATGIFQGIFRRLRLLDIANMDNEKPSFLDHTNAKLAEVCHWVVKHGPDIFAWSAEYVSEHKEDIAIALLCACTVAVLWELTPWVLEALGFEATGVRAGSVGAELMKKYMGNIPNNSWMSFFQRLGAKWGRG